MKRFYKKSLDLLTDELEAVEIAADIDDYVRYLEFERNVLINELSQVNNITCEIVLNRNDLMHLDRNKQ